MHDQLNKEDRSFVVRNHCYALLLLQFVFICVDMRQKKKFFLVFLNCTIFSFCFDLQRMKMKTVYSKKIRREKIDYEYQKIYPFSTKKNGSTRTLKKGNRNK